MAPCVLFENKDDLESYFKVTEVNEAIYDTIEDSDKLQCLILDLSPDADLEKLFRPLDNRQTAALMLDKKRPGSRTMAAIPPG